MWCSSSSKRRLPTQPRRLETSPTLCPSEAGPTVSRSSVGSELSCSLHRRGPSRELLPIHTLPPPPKHAARSSHSSGAHDDNQYADSAPPPHSPQFPVGGRPHSVRPEPVDRVRPNGMRALGWGSYSIKRFLPHLLHITVQLSSPKQPGPPDS